MLLPSGNPFKCHEEILFLQPLIPPKRFDFFPLCVGINAQKVQMRSDFSLKTIVFFWCSVCCGMVLYANGNKMNVVVYGSQMGPTVWGHIVDVGHNGKMITPW